jgi:hypothetical protein
VPRCRYGENRSLQFRTGRQQQYKGWVALSAMGAAPSGYAQALMSDQRTLFDAGRYSMPGRRGGETVGARTGVWGGSPSLAADPNDNGESNGWDGGDV